MATPLDAKQRAASTYNAASDFYDHPVNTFWQEYGRRTVSRLGPKAGAKILDVCCGSGASAIPAAEAVGSEGFVLGIDLAENLIELAKTKARERALGNVEFRVADMLDLGLPAASFDAVICVRNLFCPGHGRSGPGALGAAAAPRPTCHHHMGTALLRTGKYGILERCPK